MGEILKRAARAMYTCNLHDYIDADEIDKGPLLHAMGEGLENIMVEKWVSIIWQEGSKCKKR